MDNAQYRFLDAAELMPSFPKSRRDQIAEAKRGNMHYEILYGDPKNPRVVYPPEKAKRASPVRDPLIPSEHQSQAAVIAWWSYACKGYNLPEFALFAIPNGGARDPITGARLKAEGVRPGIPDLMLAVKRGRFAGLLIEMKKKGNAPSTDQREVISYLIGAGYDSGVLYSADGAIGAIQEYLARYTD